MQISHVILVLIQFVVASRGVTDYGQEASYIFTYPKLIIARSNVKVCLTLYNFNLPAKLIVTFTRNKCVSSRQTGCNNAFVIVESEDYSFNINIIYTDYILAHQCVNLEVPQISEDIIYDALEIKIEGERKKIVKKGRVDITIVNRKEHIFVETDHAIYKPEDEVKIRLLGLQFSLLPIETFLMANVILYGPDHMKVKQWPNVTFSGGIAELTYRLQENAQAGFWTLEVNDLLKTDFQVERYTLERFKTTLEHPQDFFQGDVAVVITLCSEYSFKEPVQGVGTIEIMVNSLGIYKQSPVVKFGKLVGGCIKMKLYTKQLTLSNSLYNNIEIVGTVVEESTNVTMTKTGVMTINSASYDIMNEPYKLKSGLPFTGHLQIRDKNVLASEQNVTVCYVHNEYVKRHSVCKQILVRDEDVIPFTIPPLKRVENEVDVKAYMHNVEDKKYYSRPEIQLKSFYSISNNSLLIMPLHKDVWECGDHLTFNIMYTLNNINQKEIVFNYMVVSRFGIVEAGHKVVTPQRNTFDPNNFENVIMSSDSLNELNAQFDTFTIDVVLNKNVYTDIKLMVFYVTNGEVIADDLSVSVKSCLPTKVDVQWEQNQVEPNSKASLKILTEIGSFCTITAADIATSFSRTPNTLTPQDILIPFQNVDFEILSSDEQGCIKPDNYKDTANFWSNEIHTDANSIFEENKIGVISNLRLVTKPCKALDVKYQSKFRHIWDEPEDVPFDKVVGVQRQSKNDSAKAIRTFFPRTWLWDAVIISEPKTVHEVNVPGSITRWVTNVLCIGNEGGVGISTPIELVVKKPFFVELILPYSVKRNIELVHMKVVIHNYFEYYIPVILEIVPNEFIRTLDEEPTIFTYCMKPLEITTHVFNFTALQIGSVNITVAAAVAKDVVTNCTDKIISTAEDIIVKSIKVEPEAYGEHISNTALLCSGDWGKPDEVSWEPTIPEDQMVMNLEADIIIDSNIFTPIIQDVNVWIKRPAGTADDIIKALITNFYALEYIETNLKNDTQILTAINNLQTGIEKSSTYFRENGLFIANFDTDTLKPIFTTAFVIRLFNSIKKYILVDDGLINKAVTTLLSYQRSNGCFNIVPDEVQTTSLTSFVMISLLEINANISSEQKELTKRCLTNEMNKDNYAMAISTYALFLLGDDNLTSSNIKALIAKSNQLANMMFWQEESGLWSTGEINVEVEGYMLMSLVHKGSPDYINYARLIIRWLLSNPQRGQYSALDMAVTLEGITRFSKFVNSKSSNVTLTVNSQVNGVTTFNFRPGIKHDKKIVNVNTVPDSINIQISGDGCVVLKSSLEFNTYDSNMVLDTTTMIKDTSKCTISLTSCLSANSTERSLLAILKVFIPKGYAVDETSLMALDKEKTGVKKYKYVDHIVELYFTGVTLDKKCASFIIQETVEVSHRTNIVMQVSNYHAAEAAMQRIYLLPSCKFPDETNLVDT